MVSAQVETLESLPIGREAYQDELDKYIAELKNQEAGEVGEVREDD